MESATISFEPDVPTSNPVAINVADAPFYSFGSAVPVDDPYRNLTITLRTSRRFLKDVDPNDAEAAWRTPTNEPKPPWSDPNWLQWINPQPDGRSFRVYLCRVRGGIAARYASAVLPAAQVYSEAAGEYVTVPTSPVLVEDALRGGDFAQGDWLMIEHNPGLELTACGEDGFVIRWCGPEFNYGGVRSTPAVDWAWKFR